MGVRLASSGTITLAAASIPNATEGIVLTTGLIGLMQDNAQVQIFFFLNFAVGASATSVTFRLRRGGALTSTLINIATGPTVVASTTNGYSMVYVDTPGVVGQVQYTMTAAVAGGAAVLSLNDGCLLAMVL